MHLLMNHALLSALLATVPVGLAIALSPACAPGREPEGIAQFDIVAHSLGGMLAVRIARAFPDRIRRLLLAAPIGLEDYRFYAPPTPTEKILENEDKLTADGYRRQLMTNYSLKLPPEQVT